jgi:hypothetical protein
VSKPINYTTGSGSPVHHKDGGKACQRWLKKTAGKPSSPPEAGKKRDGQALQKHDRQAFQNRDFLPMICYDAHELRDHILKTRSWVKKLSQYTTIPEGGKKWLITMQ